MPSLQIITNVKVADSKAFVVEFSKLASEVLKKPEAYMTISYVHNEALSWNGTFDPAFVMTVYSLGNLSYEANEVYSKAFFDFFEKKLGVPGDRGYISFIDPGNAYMGHQGTTFGTIFGTK